MMYPEADALLDAIFDNPADDTARLVYADWLQEHGHEDYAQFIRLSVKADGGSKPPAERKRLRDERHPFWQRIVSRQECEFGRSPETVQIYRSPSSARSAVLTRRSEGWTVHGYSGGICDTVVAHRDDFLETIPKWWPVITPSELQLYAIAGSEPELADVIGKHLPWLRSLHCLSRVGMDVHDIDEYCFPPLDGKLIERLAAPGLLPRLTSLHITIASADVEAVAAFSRSALCAQLQSLQLEVRFPGTDRYERTYASNEDGPDKISTTLRSFLEELATVE